MAEYDGSVRIGVKMELDNAEKQLEHLKSRMQGQIKEINQQAQAVNKLKADYDKLLSGSKSPKVQKEIEKLTKELEKATQESDELGKKYQDLMAIVEKVHPGNISAMKPETKRDLDELSRQMDNAANRANELRERLKTLTIPPEQTEEAKKFREEIEQAEATLAELKSAKANTEIDVSGAEAKVSGLKEELQKIKDTSKVADQEIINLQKELNDLKLRKEDLEAAGVGMGYEEYDKVITRMTQINEAQQEYKRSLQDTSAMAEQEASKISSIARGQYALLSETLKQLEAQKNSLGLALGKTARADYAGLAAEIDRVKQSMMECREQFTEADEAAQSLLDIRDGATVADERIVDLTKELESLNKQKDKMEAAGVGLGFQDYDETVSRIREIKGELNAYSSSLGQADTKSESWMSRLGKSAKRMGAATVSAAKKAGSAVGGLMKRITNLGRNKGFEKAGRSASHFASRLKEIVKGALFFNIISRALTGLTNQLGKYLSVNKNFSAALDGIKSNLLTAFQPIYEAAMPALTKLMEALESASAKLASFTAMIFGTTASQAQQNAKDLYEQANAEEAVGEAAEDAEKKQKKFLASFDTIEKLGEEESKTSQDKKTDEKDKLGFDTAFEEVKVPQWLTDFWKVFQDSWKQYGEATVQAFRFAMDGLKAAAVSFGQVFMGVWTDGTGLAFLNQIQLLLQQILLMIGNIGQTFAQVWSSGVGEMVLHELFNLLTTILGIMTSMAASFNAVWTGGAGEAVLTALLTLLATVLGIIGDIAGAFKAAWDSGAGEAALEAIAFAITAVLTMLNSVGQAFRDAWNDSGLGVQIWTDIINIIKGVFEIIGQLAARFTEAWEANENGKAIWTAILGIIENVTGAVESMVQKTAEWASKLNFEPLISGARELLEKLNPVIGTIGEAIASIWENTVLPFFTYLIEDGIPALLEGLSGIFDYLASHPETLKTLTELVIQFVAAFEFAKVIESVAALAKAFDPVTFAITSAISAIVLLVANFQKMNSLERVVGVVGAVTAALGALAVVIFAIQGGAFGVAMGVAALVAGLAMVAAAVGGAAKRSYSASGRSSFSAASYSSAMPAYSLAKLPHLADGAVISPNNEFLAVLGDQRAGTNIEAPLSTIEQAVDNVLTRRGLMGGGTTKVNVSFTGSLAQLARVLQPEINVETQRLGPDLVGV